jgi:HSP20 family molecular chaperone IbpA
LPFTIEDGQLVAGGQQIEEHNRDFLYRGIAARRFKRSFGLANGVEVGQAELHNGLLAIELERPRKDVRVRTVGIVGDSEKATTQRAPAPARATVSDAE